MKKTLIIILLLFVCGNVYATDYFTSRYNLRVPEEGTRNWASKISQDIISIDNVLYMVSQDSAFVDGGTIITLRTVTDNMNIGGTATPLVKLQVDGEISTDAIKWSAESKASPDVTAGCPALVVSKDTDGTVRLQFYNGSTWQRVSLE